MEKTSGCFEIITHISTDYTVNRKRGSPRGEMVSKLHDALIFSPEQPSPMDDTSLTPGILIFIGPVPNADPIPIERIYDIKDFFLQNYPNILKHSLTNPNNGDALYDRISRHYVYTDNRDVLENLAEKLCYKQRKQILSQTKLVGYLPIGRLH